MRCLYKTQPPSLGSKRLQHQGSNTISSIIGSYKSAVTKHAHRLGYKYDWQERFHDIIIRDEESYQKIADYIKNNPAGWEEDKFNPSCPGGYRFRSSLHFVKPELFPVDSASLIEAVTCAGNLSSTENGMYNL